MQCLNFVSLPCTCVCVGRTGPLTAAPPATPRHYTDFNRRRATLATAGIAVLYGAGGCKLCSGLRHQRMKPEGQWPWAMVRCCVL